MKRICCSAAPAWGSVTCKVDSRVRCHLAWVAACSGKGEGGALAGGAVACKEVDDVHKPYTVYDLTVDMDEGGERERTIASREVLSVGQDVRVTDDRVQPM